jgi:hypothetical protein
MAFGDDYGKTMPIIYHYCDATAFLSIVGQRKLRLCSTAKMNDSSEGSVVESAVKSRLNNQKGRTLSTEIELFIQALKDEIYACCFSGEKDSTVQWMSYADSGKGFAIGFDTSEILSIYPDKSTSMTPDEYLKGDASKLHETNGIRLSQVIYFNSANRSRIMQIVGDKLKHENVKGDDKDDFHYRIAQTIAWFDTITKDDGFNREVEYRLTHTPESLTLDQILDTTGTELLRSSILGVLHWRASRYGLAPYYEFAFPVKAVKEIWIGPRNPDHPNVSAQHLIKQYCARQGIGHALVQVSRSPYRG